MLYTMSSIIRRRLEQEKNLESREMLRDLLALLECPCELAALLKKEKAS